MPYGVSDSTRGLALSMMPKSGMARAGQGQSAQMERAFIDATARGQNVMPRIYHGRRRRNQPISQQAAQANFQSTLRDAGVMFPGASAPQRVDGMMSMMPQQPVEARGAVGRQGMGRGGGQMPMQSMSQNPYV